MRTSARLRYAFYAGLFLVTIGVMVGVGALGYQFALLDQGQSVPDGPEEILSMDELTESEQRIVERAIDGESFVFESRAATPGHMRGDLAVRVDETYYTFSRDVHFQATSAPGIASLCLLGSGLGAVVWSIRRDMQVAR